MLGAVSHVALVVNDPARTVELFERLFAVRAVHRVDADGHDETFVRLGATWFVLVKAAVERQRTGDHVAFHVTSAVLRSTADRLKEMNLEFILARGDTSLYFFDYDNHVFELDTIGVESELNAESDIKEGDAR
ncbi:MAG: VOC family protein [Thermoanaerobaculia bacterium]